MSVADAELPGPTTTPHPPAPPPTSIVDRWGSGVGALLLRLHFYAGVLVAPFLLIGAITGLLYTAVPQLDHLAYGNT